MSRNVETAPSSAGTMASSTNDGKRAHHERERELDRQRAGLALGPAPALAADVVGQAVEHRRQRQAVAIGRGEGVDERGVAS